jgi:hypothetical protein
MEKQCCFDFPDSEQFPTTEPPRVFCQTSTWCDQWAEGDPR